jgi:hypothetical protein
VIPTRSLRAREVALELLYRVKGQHSYRARIVRDPNNLECTEDQALCFFRISARSGAVTDRLRVTPLPASMPSADR